MLALFPGAFWLWYMLRRPIDPRPLYREALWAFSAGCAGAFLVLWMRPYLELVSPVGQTRFSRDLVDAFLVTATTEESVKMAAVLVATGGLRGSVHREDGVVMAIATALGFASAENVIWLVAHDDVPLIAQRAFTSTLAHVGFTGSLGASLVLARSLSRPRGEFLVAAALLAAIGLHGAYDFMLWQGEQWPSLALLVLLPLSLVVAGFKHQHLRQVPSEAES